MPSRSTVFIVYRITLHYSLCTISLPPLPPTIGLTQSCISHPIGRSWSPTWGLCAMGSSELPPVGSMYTTIGFKRSSFTDDVPFFRIMPRSESSGESISDRWEGLYGGNDNVMFRPLPLQHEPLNNNLSLLHEQARVPPPPPSLWGACSLS